METSPPPLGISITIFPLGISKRVCHYIRNPAPCELSGSFDGSLEETLAVSSLISTGTRLDTQPLAFSRVMVEWVLCAYCPSFDHEIALQSACFSPSAFHQPRPASDKSSATQSIPGPGELVRVDTARLWTIHTSSGLGKPSPRMHPFIHPVRILAPCKKSGPLQNYQT